MTRRRKTARAPTSVRSTAQRSSPRTTRNAASGRYIAQLDAAHVFDAPIVTQVSGLDRFYPGEDYHQDYAAKHANEPYIQFVAAPKVAKLRRYFADRLKGATTR